VAASRVANSYSPAGALKLERLVLVSPPVTAGFVNILSLCRILLQVRWLDLVFCFGMMLLGRFRGRDVDTYPIATNYSLFFLGQFMCSILSIDRIGHEGSRLI
jgi:hypothetical protein